MDYEASVHYFLWKVSIFVFFLATHFSNFSLVYLKVPVKLPIAVACLRNDELLWGVHLW